MKLQKNDHHSTTSHDINFEKQAQRTIRKYVLLASGAGFLGRPLLSSAAIAGLQVMMVRDLCKLFDKPFDHQWLRVAIQSTTSSVFTQLLALGISRIPGMSRMASGFSGAGMAGVYTATVGEYYKIHFQNGGDLTDASLTELGNYFIDEFKRGDLSLTQFTNPLAIVDRMFIK